MKLQQLFSIAYHKDWIREKDQDVRSSNQDGKSMCYCLAQKSIFYFPKGQTVPFKKFYVVINKIALL